MGSQAGLLERHIGGVKAKQVGPGEELVVFAVRDERGVANAGDLGGLLDRPAAGVPLADRSDGGLAALDGVPDRFDRQAGAANGSEAGNCNTAKSDSMNVWAR